MGKAIVVTSGKGGTGKTAAVGAVGACLAALGHTTLCLDCDVGMKNLDLVLGMADLALLDFNDVLEGRVLLENAVTEHPTIENLYFLTAPSAFFTEEPETDSMAELIKHIKDSFDFCLIDSPAGISSGFRLAAAGADMAIVVTTPDTSSMRDGNRVVSELYSMGIPEIRLLVNKIKKNTLRRFESTIDDVIDTVGAQLIGIVAYDENVTISANLQKPLVLYESTGAARHFLRIAQRLIGLNIPIGKI